MGFPSSNQKGKGKSQRGWGPAGEIPPVILQPLTGQLQLQGWSWQQVLARLAAA